MTDSQTVDQKSRPRVIALIPAPKSSQGLPRKTLRLLAGKPLMYYAIETARRVETIEHILVVTDSEEIRDFAELVNVEVLMSSKTLTPEYLSKYLNDVVHTIEENTQNHFDFVLTLQPTCPLLTPHTLSAAIEHLSSMPNHAVSLTPVVVKKGSYWTRTHTQLAPLIHHEFHLQNSLLQDLQIFTLTQTQTYLHSPMSSQDIINGQVIAFEIPQREALHIMRPTDWWVAEKLLTQRRILLRADGYHLIGLGHIMRVLLLAHHLIDHQLLLVTQSKHEQGAQLLAESQFPVRCCVDDDDVLKVIDEFQPHIIINDILDTSRAWVEETQKRNIFTVNFEDLGTGAKIADLVINALYEAPLPRTNTFWSHQYFCLRDEFFLLKPRPVSDHIQKVLISFGGADPNNYTLRILKLLNRAIKPLEITIIMGRAYAQQTMLEEYLNNDHIYTRSPHQVTVLSDVKMISKHMQGADLVFTSAGRTVYEVASLGTPMIVLAQNQRELSHSFVRLENGVVNLGLGTLCDDDEVWETFESLHDAKLRSQLQARMLAHDLKGGAERVIQLILNQYQAWKSTKDTLEKNG